MNCRALKRRGETEREKGREGGIEGGREGKRRERGDRENKRCVSH